MKKGLGKSLDEIIHSGVRRAAVSAPFAPPENSAPPSAISTAVSAPPSLVSLIPISRIQANPNQPRRQFDEASLEELAASIRQHGVLQAITVRPAEGGIYQIIAGERRWRASQLAGLAEIPALIKGADEATALEIALVENLQREDLNPLEEAQGYAELSKRFSLTQEDIAEKVGKDRATVANALRLLQLSPQLHTYLIHGQLTAGHAKCLLGLEGEELQVRAAESVMKEGLSVRATERLVRALGANRKPRARSGAADEAMADANLKAVEDALQQRLATRVRIAGKADRGRIEIEYFTAEDLGRLVQVLGISL
ncbi:MAG: ParB/RepB/Spo0J family partition protein [Verrucomicrobiae bacterium]|nr:ParB/RepB/Spo0J family partition protein [Verrucomicrobiae bacterium]